MSEKIVRGCFSVCSCCISATHHRVSRYYGNTNIKAHALTCDLPCDQSASRIQHYFATRYCGVHKLLLRWLLPSFPSDKLCALHRDHHHPRPEAAVSRCRREWVQHLPVSKPASVATATHFPCTCTVCSSEVEPDWLIVRVSGPGNLLCRFDWCVKNEWMSCWTGSGWCKVLGRFSERKDIVLMKNHSFV